MSNACLIVTDPELMRGIDYRAAIGKDTESDGIDLLVARSFNSPREVEQGLSRVGRYNEPSGRYSIASVCLLDQTGYDVLR